MSAQKYSFFFVQGDGGFFGVKINWRSNVLQFCGYAVLFLYGSTEAKSCTNIIYLISSSVKRSPHSGQNLGGFFGSSGFHPHLSHL